MPLPVEGLNADSTLRDAREAISASIAQCMREGGRTQEQCAGQAYGIARDRAPHLDLDEGRQK